MDKRHIRDAINLCGALLLSPIYFPHIISIVFLTQNTRQLIRSDIDVIKEQIRLNLYYPLAFIYLIHNNSYYRSLFYYRVGPLISMLIKWYRPGNKYFSFSQRTKIGKSFSFVHPYGTIINAESIGENFRCIQLTTIGIKGHKRPIIGDNVTCGANVTIIGDIRIGNNVTIGAGAVVVKDIPDNCIVAGNPAKVIRNKSNY